MTFGAEIGCTANHSSKGVIPWSNISILLKEPFALKNSETVYFTSIFSTPSYSGIVPIDNFDLTFFYFYFVFEVFDTIQF